MYVSDLARFITDTLDLLTWHNINNVIPEDQIWLKVGGNHGGGSFKMPLQTANIQSPNSRHNAFMNHMAKCKRQWACTTELEAASMGNQERR